MSANQFTLLKLSNEAAPTHGRYLYWKATCPVHDRLIPTPNPGTLSFNRVEAAGRPSPKYMQLRQVPLVYQSLAGVWQTSVCSDLQRRSYAPLCPELFTAQLPAPPLQSCISASVVLSVHDLTHPSPAVMREKKLKQEKFGLVPLAFDSSSLTQSTWNSP